MTNLNKFWKNLIIHPKTRHQQSIYFFLNQIRYLHIYNTTGKSTECSFNIYDSKDSLYDTLSCIGGACFAFSFVWFMILTFSTMSSKLNDLKKSWDIKFICQPSYKTYLFRNHLGNIHASCLFNHSWIEKAFITSITFLFSLLLLKIYRYPLWEQHSKQ